DPESTSPDGVRALVSLLRDEGVEVVDASSLEEVRRAARPDTLLVVAETYFLVDDDGLRTLAGLPGDRLLVQPVSPTREALAPEITVADETSFGGEPDCDMREAERAGDVELGTSATYEAVDGV
ncbi:MAG: DUF4350 domain-containing protein, partial [Mycolicibacterium sp.]|nr:DUF4350 domain-containing protein [Mycolicibacterium sp.]